MSSGKKKTMSREEAAELYQDLRNALAQSKGGAAPKGKGQGNPAAKQIAAEISKALSREKSSGPAPRQSRQTSHVETPSYSFDDTPEPAPRNRGAGFAVFLIVMFSFTRLALAGMEAYGIVGIDQVEAMIKPQAPVQQPQQPFNREEIKILTSLDGRRAELAEKSRQMEDRERQLDLRDREFAVRVAQLKELTDQLKNEREKNEKKRNAQIEQLANVYGSMSPQEAAQLIEQLDVQIALSLIEKMPEKKIGQILALMSKERALTLTKMLSGKVQG